MLREKAPLEMEAVSSCEKGIISRILALTSLQMIQQTMPLQLLEMAAG